MTFRDHKITGGVGADDPYWEGLEAGELRLPRCQGCDRWTWPAHFRCGVCGAWDFRWEPVTPEGRVFTWTRTWYAFERVRERADDIPYVSVLAELPQAGGARVLGILEGGQSGLRPGAALVGRIAAASPKSKNYPSLVWRLVEQGE